MEYLSILKFHEHKQMGFYMRVYFESSNWFGVYQSHLGPAFVRIPVILLQIIDKIAHRITNISENYL